MKLQILQTLENLAINYLEIDYCIQTQNVLTELFLIKLLKHDIKHPPLCLRGWKWVDNHVWTL